MSRRLRTVLIGFGKIADSLADDPVMGRHFRYATHAQVLRDHPAFEWSAVVDVSEVALARARDRWGVTRLAKTIEDLPADLRPEVAVIATPPEFRGAAIERLPSLKAVMFEKPIAENHTAASVLLQICKARGIAVQVNHWRRGVDRLRQLAAGALASDIGALQAGFATYGNGLHNNGSHLIDLIRMLLGEVSAVQAVGPTNAPPDLPLRGDVHIPFVLTLAAGAPISCLPLDYRHYRELGLDLWGERGRLALMHETLTMHRYPVRPNRGLAGSQEIASDSPVVEPVDVGQALFAMYTDLAAAVEERRAPCSDGLSAQANERILSAVLESADAGGRRIALP